MADSRTSGVSRSGYHVKKKPHKKRISFSAFQVKDDSGEEMPVRGKMDISFFFLIIVLQTIGLIMLFSASYVTALYEEGDSLHYVIRQTIFAVAGLGLMIVASYVDYHIWRKFKWPIYIAGMICMAWALTFEGVAGARRWVYIGKLISFQPSEIMKFAVAIFCAHLISINYKRMDRAKYGFWPFWIIILPVMGMMVLQRHLSGLILIGLISCTVMVIGGSRLRWFFGLAAAVGVLGAVGLLLVGPGKFSYVLPRLESWLHPFEGNIRGKKWQTVQGLYAIGSGGLFGVGLGNSTQKHLYVSEPQNDMIFSIVCEELGFVGAVVIILLFVLLVYSGISIAMRAPDKFGCMLALGLTAQVGWQALLNIAVVTNSMPTTGISLPFFSSGGTALTMLLAQMGVILNISRYGRAPEPKQKKVKEKLTEKSDSKV